MQAHRWVKRMAEMRRQHAVVCMWVVMAASLGAVAEAGAPTAMFVFGDSLVDVGNNNQFTSLARANYSPYGIDRSDHAATGRFCNGRIIPDLMSKDRVPMICVSTFCNCHSVRFLPTM